MALGQILFWEFLYGLTVASVAEYTAARFEGFWKNFLVFGVVSILLLLVVESLFTYSIEENAILRFVVFIIGLYFGIKFGNVAYQYRQIS